MRFKLLQFVVVVVAAFVVSFQATAQKDSEKELAKEIIISLQTADDSSYVALFPTMKLMRDLAYTYSTVDTYQLQRIFTLRRNIRHLREFDAEVNSSIVDQFDFVRQKGSDSGIHWGDILIAKYEFDKQRLPRELIGFELIAPIRMQGYIFIRDMLTRIRYGIAVKDIFMMDGKWYGGRVINILQASNVAEYEESLRDEEIELRKLLIAKANGTLDSLLAAKDSVRKSNIKVSQLYDDEEEEEEKDMYKEIVDRKLYTGYFDKQMKVELYMRFIKGTCPETVCEWEAMYRFDDMDEFIVLDVERREDGTFVMTEEEVGVMELKLQGTTFTGNWTAFSDKTEYEAYLKEEAEMRDRKLFKLDRMFEELYWE